MHSIRFNLFWETTFYHFLGETSRKEFKSRGIRAISKYIAEPIRKTIESGFIQIGWKSIGTRVDLNQISNPNKSEIRIIRIKNSVDTDPSSEFNQIYMQLIRIEHIQNFYSFFVVLE